MSDELVIMFPDLRGEGATGAFGRELLQRYADDDHTHLIPVINGVGPEELKRISVGLHPKFKPAPVNLGPGQLNTLVAGYRYALARHFDATIVRLDTNEHPVELIPTLVQRVRDHGAMAIGNLRFSPKTIVPGSPDEFFHIVCRTLYETSTHGALPLSGAHGFQAFAPGVCADVLEAALLMIERANRDGGPPLQWGLCGAMAMGALAIGTPVYLVDLLATQPRNRPAEKVAAQLQDFIRTVLAAATLYDLDKA